MSDQGYNGDEDAEDDVFTTCGNCGGEITNEMYNRSGVDDYCDDCPELDTDPRTASFRGYANEEERIERGLPSDDD